MNIIIFGLSLTSSWGNGHATTFRSLVRALAKRGHHVTFFERNQPWYAQNRDCVSLEYCEVIIYDHLSEIQQDYADRICVADAVIVGSYVPEGALLGEWVIHNAEGITAFYDIDTPITLNAIRAKTCPYLTAKLISAYDHYLSFTGGSIIPRITAEFGATSVHPFYCAVDEDFYFSQDQIKKWDLGYLGTYAKDRQPALNEFLIKSAKHLPHNQFVIAGPGYPELSLGNIERIDHLPPKDHCWFYNSQRFTLNVTRAEMVSAGYSPSVRLFEAAACGVPIISDEWQGLEEFFVPGKEILVVKTREDVREILEDMPEKDAQLVGTRAQSRVLHEYTAKRRAEQLESLLGFFQEPLLEAINQEEFAL